MKIVFMGTPDFAVTVLEALIDAGHYIAGVFTQPDKKTGRKQILTPPPVKIAAQKSNIPVFQPNTFKDGAAFEIINALSPEIIVVAAYGKILPKSVLEYPKYGCVCVHASLLPEYRGAAPIQRAVINGETQTGISIMQIDEGVDTGDIILTEKTPIGINETSADLFARLSVIGANAAVKALSLISSGKAVRTPQPQGDFGYAKMIDKSMCNIDWSRSAFEIHNLIRGLQTQPCASTFINGKCVKIHKSVLSDKTGAGAGKITDNKKTLTVSCGDGKCLDILEVQPEGKKKMDIKSFLAGNKLEINQFIGE